MPLPFEVEKLETVPEAQRALYVERGGKFHLDVEGLDGDPKGFKTALNAERTRAAREEQQRKELEKKYEGIDPDEHRKLVGMLEGDEDAKLIAAGKIQEVIDKKTEKQRLDHERKLAAAEAKVKEANDEKAKSDGKLSKFAQRALGYHVGQTALAVGIEYSGSIEDSLLAAKAEGWTIDDDSNPVLFNKDGDVVMDKTGKAPFSLKDWFEEKRVTRKNWWPAQNSGGGAGGDRGGRGGGPDWSKLKPTERMTAARARAGKV
jgi:hypothetical protein